jgi:hypothetical protein
MDNKRNKGLEVLIGTVGYIIGSIVGILLLIEIVKTNSIV